MAKQSRIARHSKSTEYEIVVASRQAEVGWRDLYATQRNSLADAWDFLVSSPLQKTPTAHPLRGELAVAPYAGVTHERWQYELNRGARIWYFVVGRVVYLEQVYTKHPNQTK